MDDKEFSRESGYFRGIYNIREMAVLKDESLPRPILVKLLYDASGVLPLEIRKKIGDHALATSTVGESLPPIALKFCDLMEAETHAEIPMAVFHRKNDKSMSGPREYINIFSSYPAIIKQQPDRKSLAAGLISEINKITPGFAVTESSQNQFEQALSIIKAKISQAGEI